MRPSVVKQKFYNMDALSKQNQFMIITGIFFAFTLCYGYLQELVTIHLFSRRFGLFLTLTQFLGYSLLGGLATQFRSISNTSAEMEDEQKNSDTEDAIVGDMQDRRVARQNSPQIPFKYAFALAFMQATMQALSNLSMRYLNYPAKVLFKSCRPLPVMIFAHFALNRRYKTIEWLAVLCMMLGLCTFVLADFATSPELSPIGILLITASLMFDAALLNLQEHCYATLNCSEEQVVFISFTGGSVALLLVCIASGELTSAFAFMRLRYAGTPVYVASSMLTLSICGFFGVVCIAALTRRFGALVAAITSTARKAMTMLLSFLFFPKPFTLAHGVSMLIFVIGMVLKTIKDKHNCANAASDFCEENTKEQLRTVKKRSESRNIP